VFSALRAQHFIRLGALLAKYSILELPLAP
jgi:hypothetical protein